MNVAVEDTAIKAKEINRLRAMLSRPTVEQVETALHIYEERTPELSAKGAMRQALQAAFNKFKVKP
jgi:predicted GH43/DUF377 family glycosyl hydrolase